MPVGIDSVHSLNSLIKVLVTFVSVNKRNENIKQS